MTQGQFFLSWLSHKTLVRESYSSAEMSSVYSTAPADWTIFILKNNLNITHVNDVVYLYLHVFPTSFNGEYRWNLSDSKSPQDTRTLIKPLEAIISPSTVIIFTNPSARTGYDTRSIFKRSLTGLNSEFSFS